MTFRALVFGVSRLDEFDIAKTEQIFGKQLLAKLKSDPTMRGFVKDYKDHELENFWPLLAAADPTPQQDYSVGLVKIYVKDPHFRWGEDSAHARELLAQFHDLKVHRRLPAEHRDIMRVKNMADLFDLVQRFSDPTALDKGGKVTAEDPEHQKAVAESKLVHEDQYFKVYVPQTLFASCYWKNFGEKSAWCTDQEHYYNSYSKQSPLYVFIPKNPKFKGEKYQLHTQSSQFMDRSNRPIDPGPLEDERFYPFIARLKHVSLDTLHRFLPFISQDRDVFFRKANWSVLDRVDQATIKKYAPVVDFDLESLERLEDPKLQVVLTPEFQEFWTKMYAGFPKFDLGFDFNQVMGEFKAWAKANAPEAGPKKRASRAKKT